MQALAQLKPKHRAFLEHYFASGQQSATASAIAVGYSDKGAHVQASRLLRTPKVAAAINEWREEQSRKTLAPLQWKREKAVQAIEDAAKTYFDEKQGIERMIDHGAVFKGLEYLSKVDGEVIKHEKVEHSGTIVHERSIKETEEYLRSFGIDPKQLRDRSTVIDVIPEEVEAE